MRLGMANSRLMIFPIFFPLGDVERFSSDKKEKYLSKEFKDFLIQRHVQH